MTQQKLGASVLWSLTWGVGVALGVALGAYLTVVGAAGAPGQRALDSTELVTLPLVSGSAVFVVVLVGRLLLGALSASRQSDKRGG